MNLVNLVHPVGECISAVLQVPMMPPGMRALLSSGKAAECPEQEEALPVLPLLTKGGKQAPPHSKLSESQL